MFLFLFPIVYHAQLIKSTIVSFIKKYVGLETPCKSVNLSNMTQVTIFLFENTRHNYSRKWKSNYKCNYSIAN